MADVSKLKKKSTLGPPPSLDEASANLQAPEVAPAAQVHTVTRPTSTVDKVEDKPLASPPVRLDGRSARRTNRTVQFATRVSPEFDASLRAVAQTQGLLLVEILERALALYLAENER